MSPKAMTLKVSVSDIGRVRQFLSELAERLAYLADYAHEAHSSDGSFWTDCDKEPCCGTDAFLDRLYEEASLS